MGWWRRLVGRERLEHELDKELRFHVEEEAARLRRAGTPDAEARRLALASFGTVEAMKEQARDARGTRWVEDLGKDLRYSVRMMKRSPL
ncbi:MAG TPA: permease prefix domain 1-containing protein, partial [Vicinamibacterales bacterium]|nr:permease prefix domain 1-containing protein [Vicinamibacterales bacterium]